MPNFSIRYSYVKNGVVLHQSAIVRASSIGVAHDKLVRFLTRDGSFYESFKILKTSLSNFNLILS